MRSLHAPVIVLMERHSNNLPADHTNSFQNATQMES